MHPQPENYRGCVKTIGILSCYDEGKRIAETLCFDDRRMHGTEIRVARIFNTYGPRMLPVVGRVVSNFIVQTLVVTPSPFTAAAAKPAAFALWTIWWRGRFV